jgi:Dickkopf N-terminal cysteine-rich region
MLAPRLANVKLQAVSGGFAVRATPRALRAVLPRRAGDALRLVNGAAEVRVQALGIAPSAASADGSTLTYRNVAPSTDMVLSPAPGGVEEFRVLRDARAPTTLSWEITPPSGGTVLVDGFGVEVLDVKGVLVAAATPLFALDANDMRRAVPVRFEGGALVAHVDTTGLAFPVVVDPVWSSSGNMRSVHGAPILISLSDGKVMEFPTDAAPWVDIYDPASKTWSTGPDVPIPWDGDEAVGLADGNVLAVSASDKTFARFNYPAKTWTTFSQTQISACAGCVLTLMKDGRVLKMSGTGATELYNPTTATWSAAATLTYLTGAPSNPVALDDGRVFVTDESLGQVGYIYDPTANAWSSTNAGVKYTGARLVKLADGRVMEIGLPWGGGPPPPQDAIYDPTSNTWSATYDFIRNRTNPAVITLQNGRVMVVAGGYTESGYTTYYNDAEIWDPTYNSWTLIGAFPGAGVEHPGIALMPGGSVLIAGGNGATGITETTYRYDPIPDGGSCTPPDYPITCNAPYCVEGVCCNSASCPGGTCTAPAVSGRAAGTCALNLGQACSKDSDCASDHCVDGVCCNSACNGQCAACNLPPSPGTCRAVVGQPIGGRAACAGAGTDCGATCDGTDMTQCNYAPAGTVACGTDSCVNGTETKAGTCDGAGTCVTTSDECDTYACGTTACEHSCATDTDCAAGNYCSGDECLPKVGLGTSCTSTAMCPSGLFCTDGVCCGVQACATGASCSAGPTKGQCSKLLGTDCADDAQCASGHCVDGVCCNTVCDGQCEACDLSSTRGTCSPVVGAPHAPRKACDDGGGNACKARSCDGKDTTACDGYANGATVQCKPASCNGSNVVPMSSCDGAGTCVTPPVSSCGRYACNPATLSCRSNCTDNSDCATGFACLAGVCSQGARCSDDGLSSISSDGVTHACSPFICGTGSVCLQKCSTSDDCAPGFVCDPTSSQCKKSVNVANSSGGCSIGAGPERAPALPLGLLLVAGLALERRRRHTRLGAADQKS